MKTVQKQLKQMKQNINYYLKKKKERTGSNYFNDSKAFIEYWNGIDDIYKNVKEYNPNKKRKILIIFHGMIVDILINKKLNPIVTELFIRGRKLSISLLFIALSYFAAPKNNWLYSTHYFVMKILNKQNFNKLHLIIHQILTFKT